MHTELELPLCAVCRTAVARIEVLSAASERGGVGAYLLVAHCHGEREVVDVSDADLLAMVPSSLRLGVAFVDQRDVAFSAPRPYGTVEAYRYGAHGDTPNGQHAPSLNGSRDFHQRLHPRTR